MTHERIHPEPSWRRLYRNPRRGWIAGVCAGLADYFGVRIANRHRALGDAEATGEIFCRLLESLHFHDVPDLRSARLFRHARESAAS